MVTKLIALISIIVPAITAAAQPKHPFLIFNADEIPAMQQKTTGLEHSRKALAKIREKVDGWKKFYLPVKNAPMRKNWMGTVTKNSGTARYAAFLYTITKEKKYLDMVKDYFNLYADGFDDRVDFNNIDDKDGIRIYMTGRLGFNSAWAYDMVYNDLSTAERKKAEDGLLRKIVAMVKATAGQGNHDDAWAGDTKGEINNKPHDYNWGPGQWNGTMLCNMGITAIGFVLGDEEIYQHGIDNWKTYVGRDMLADGFWAEEDFHYSRLCYTTIITIAEMAHRFGYAEDLYRIKLNAYPAGGWAPGYAETYPVEGKDSGTRTIKSFLDAQLAYQYPNLKPGNWGWQTNRASFTDNGPHVTYYELAYKRYGDPLYAWILSKMDRTRGDHFTSGHASPIIYGDVITGTPDLGDHPADKSTWYNHAGWAVLKSTEGPEYWNSEAIYSFMPYGLPRTKPLRRQSVDLFAFGKVIAPRVAKMTRHQAHDKAYYLHDDSWNALMVDHMNAEGINTDVRSAKCRFHDFNPDIKIFQGGMEVIHRVKPSIWYEDVAERDASKDYRQSRTLGLTGQYLVDITHAAFKHEQLYKHNYYWHWHAFGECTVKGKRPHRNTAGQWSATWKDTDGIGVKTVMLGSGSDGATNVRVLKNDLTTYVKVMRGNYEEAFIAVHEPYKNETAIDTIIKLYEDENSVAFMVEDRGSYRDYVAVAFDTLGLSFAGGAGSMTISGHYGYVRITGDAVAGRGSITTFDLPGESRGPVSLNGKKVTGKIKNGRIRFKR